MANTGSGPADAGVGSGRLPTELTRFVGREAELRALADLVGRSRLLTLTGPAGSGKTRLALQLAAGDRLPGDAVWVELASLRDPGLIPTAVAEALGLREEVRGGDARVVARLVGDRAATLVLDNCEHLVEAAAVLARTLLEECPALSIVATSREALGVPGERAWLVPPLALPEPDDPEDGAAEAVQLFVDRARDVVPDFALTPDTTPLVVEICRRLDGIPLAIELAAARVKVLALAEIRDRLDDIFRLLTSGGRTVVPRHRTLRAAIDWSHDLLQPDGRELLHRLAVFRGGFGLEAAEQIGAGGTLAEEDVLDVVARLVDRSMLSVREVGSAARYGMLEAVRQYATARLVESGEEAEVRARHARWALERVAEAEPHFLRRERRDWVDRLYPDLDNLRSALEWTREHDPAAHVRLAGGLWWFWFSTQHWGEAGRWIEGALALSAAAEPTLDRARLLFAAGALSALRARAGAARPFLEEAAELAARHGDGRLEAYALNYLGMTYAGEGRPEAVDLCRRAEAWFRAHDDLYGLRLAALLQGSAAMGLGDLEEAERLNREGLRVARLFGQPRELAVSLQNLAAVHITAGRLEEAEGLVREALAASRSDPSLFFISVGLGYLGEIRAGLGEPLEAVRLLGAAEAVRQRIGAVPFPVDRARLEAATARLRDALDPEAFQREWDAGRSQRPEAILEALAAGGPAVDASPADAPASGEGVPTVGTAAGTDAGTDAGSSAPAPSARPVGAVVELQVDALGPFAVTVAGDPVPAERWSYAKPRELLVYLLLHPAGATRDQVGEALWPGAPRANVKNSFHVTLHHLRKALGHPEWIVLDGDRYRLDPRLRWILDADTFERDARAALDAEGPRRAEALRPLLGAYRGDLLADDVVGRWIDEHRDRLRRVYVDVALAYGDALEPDDPAAAAALYARLAAVEELDEEVHRRLMAAWSRSGDRARALKHFERVAELLRTELDAEPETETTALYERIRAGVPA